MELGLFVIVLVVCLLYFGVMRYIASYAVSVRVKPQVDPSIKAAHAQLTVLRRQAKVRARLARRFNQSYL